MRNSPPRFCMLSIYSQKARGLSLRSEKHNGIFVE
jgi:hypothetical protein